MVVFFAHLSHTPIRTTGLPTSASTSVAGCRSMRQRKARWSAFSRCSAASGAPTSTVAAGCAVDDGDVPHSNPKGDSMTTPQPIITLFDTLLEVATKVGLAAAALFLAWAGFLYMTAGGSPRRMESAKDAAFAAIGGLAVVLLAHTIAALVQNATGLK